MRTSIEHLASCPTCLRRTLHRRTIVVDEHGDVVSDERLCIACANRGARVATPVLPLAQTEPAAPEKSARPRSRRRRGAA